MGFSWVRVGAILQRNGFGTRGLLLLNYRDMRRVARGKNGIFFMTFLFLGRFSGRMPETRPAARRGSYGQWVRDSRSLRRSSMSWRVIAARRFVENASQVKEATTEP